MATKTFCDRCDGLIAQGRTPVKVMLVTSFAAGGQQLEGWVIPELCSECVDRLREFLRPLPRVGPA